MSNHELEQNLANIAASYQEVIIDSLLDRLKKVIDQTGISRVSITGGVAANKRFREKADVLTCDFKTYLYFPSIEYCTDNAAMIAMVGYQHLKADYHSPLDLEANPNLALNENIIP